MRSRIAVAAVLAVLTAFVGVRWGTTRSTPALAVPPGAAPSPTATVTAASSVSLTIADRIEAARPLGSPRPRATIGPFSTARMTGSRAVALTFDDGPHPVWTPQVLDRLRDAGVKATFCVVGSQVRKHPDLVRRIVREGHTLCNHTWRHELDLGRQPPAAIRANLLATNQEIDKAVPGARIPYFRQPGGRWTAAAVSVAKALGMTSLDWDVDPRDWETTSAVAIGTYVVSHARPGSIVLLHDGGGDRHGTLAACPAVIRALQQRYGITLLGGL
jgi:peptidoglycan/xylan/chitin deacetylase (PgdA/CDA1 family)